MNKTHSPFFYILIPTYNRPELVIRAVQSILDQDYTNYKLIIFNDGSSENYTILEDKIKYNKYIKYIKSHNIGINKLKNLILDYIFKNTDLIDNSYFFVLDDDDYLTQNSLQLISNEILKNPNQWYCFNCRSLSDKNKDYLSYKKISYSRYLKDYKGDKHIVMKLSTLKKIRFPEKHFKNGFEHIFYCQISSKIQIIPQTVKVIEYQDDGLSSSKLYEKINSFEVLLKQIRSAPFQFILYKKFFAYLLNPKNTIKTIISDSTYYKIKRKLGLKVKNSLNKRP